VCHSPLNPLAAEKKRQDWASVNTCRIDSGAAIPREIPGETMKMHWRYLIRITSLRAARVTGMICATAIMVQRRRQWGEAGGPAPPWIKSAPPPARGLARHNERFTIEEIIKIVATRGQILRLKCTKSFVGWGSAPDPAGGAYSAPSDPLAGF